MAQNVKPSDTRLKIAIHTLGCRTNQADSVQIAEQLKRWGEFVNFDEPADVYIVNTCTVTRVADRQSRQMLFRALRSNPNALIIATGCYAVVAAQEIQTAIPEAQIVPGTNPQKIEHLVAELAQTRGIEPADQKANPLVRVRANLKVQEGCPLSCSYCIVPKARYRLYSVPINEAIKQAQHLIEAGALEIVLTGTNLGYYGKDLRPKTSLAHLLEALATEFPAVRFRLSSIEPMYFDDHLLKVASGLANFCPHFHLPLQSGSDTVLKRMRRHYTTERFAQTVQKIRATFPTAAIGADVIAGFPAETESEFLETVQFVQDLPISYLHVFPMSIRPGTEAEQMHPKLPPSVIKERAATLRKLGEAKRKAFYQQAVGTTLKIVIEQVKSGVGFGISREYLRVQVPNVSALPNTELEAKAVKVLENGTTLLVELLGEK